MTASPLGGAAWRRNCGLSIRITSRSVSQAAASARRSTGPGQRDLVEGERLGDGHLVESVARRVARDREHGHELGHVVARLLGQAQRPEVARALALDGAAHGALARVVRGERQRPRVEQPVEVLEVARRGDGRGFGILPLVHPRVHLEPEQVRRAADELPRADRGGDRARLRIEAALDEHQVHEVGGDAFLLEDALHRVHVLPGADQPALERRAAPAGEVVEPLVDQRVLLDGDGIVLERGQRVGGIVLVAGQRQLGRGGDLDRRIAER